ncbi:MAG: hypothetical protein K0S61_4817 [Anaerocolumna sp.]|nr:hypothetical protein [Anaerocolumna sp.]
MVGVAVAFFLWALSYTSRWARYTDFVNATSNREFEIKLNKLLTNPESKMIPNRGFYRTVAVNEPQ